MRINHFILALALTGFIGTTASAQVKQKMPAYKPSPDLMADAVDNYKKFDQLKDASKDMSISYLTNSKKAIDEAVNDEGLAKKADTWAYKALIYSNLALMDTVETKAAPLVQIAKEAITKTTELDIKGKQKKNIEIVNANLALFPEHITNYTINKGVREYAQKDFTTAYQSFNSALKYKPSDTTIAYYAGLSAINAKNYVAGIEKYEILTKTNFSGNKQIYLDLSRLYALQGDTVKAIATASNGSKIFTNDPALATQEIELNLLSGKQKEIISKIEEQAKKDPNNKLYAYYLGLSYAAIKDDDKAEAAYKKAIDLDPSYADATLNLGSVILNKGISLYNTANKLPASKQKEYSEMIKKSTAEFDRAFPYLDKAAQLNPKSRPALENLKTYYSIKKNQAKVDEINKTLNTL